MSDVIQHILNELTGASNEPIKNGIVPEEAIQRAVPGWEESIDEAGLRTPGVTGLVCIRRSLEWRNRKIDEENIERQRRREGTEEAFEQAVKEITFSNSPRTVLAEDINITFGLLRKQIGEWAVANFDNNESKVIGREGLVLNELAPLMGIAEELGELFNLRAVNTAPSLEALTEMVDAVGDMLVYLCDYVTRSGANVVLTQDFVDPYIINFIMRWKGKDPTDSRDQLVAAVGQLFHINLKRHQGIRGYDNPEKFAAENDRLCKHLLMCILEDSNFRGLHWLRQTWDTVVKKRNWKTNPQTAQV